MIEGILIGLNTALSLKNILMVTLVGQRIFFLEKSVMDL